jgi:hypothetical protein
MSLARQKRRSAPNSWDEVKRSWMNFGKDLMAFASLQIAWFIVWRALRHGRRKTKEQAPASELGPKIGLEPMMEEHSTPANSIQSMRGRSRSIGHGHHDVLSLDNGET